MLFYDMVVSSYNSSKLQTNFQQRLDRYMASLSSISIKRAEKSLPKEQFRFIQLSILDLPKHAPICDFRALFGFPLLRFASQCEYVC